MEAYTKAAIMQLQKWDDMSAERRDICESVLGYVCTIFIEAATSDTIQLVAIPVMPILEATLLAVGACLLATAIPLRKISKMNIVDSIETVE